MELVQVLALLGDLGQIFLSPLTLNFFVCKSEEHVYLRGIIRIKWEKNPSNI